MPGNLKERLEQLRLFETGEHPLMRAVFWNEKNIDSASQSISPRKPLFPFPKELSDRRIKGDEATLQLLQENTSSGGAIRIYDGFEAILPCENGKIRVLCDPKTDILMAGIIHKASKIIKDSTSINERLFNIALLAFGDWGQKRYPIQSLQVAPGEQLEMYLGELIWTTDFADLNCAATSFAMQVIGQAAGLDISLHFGQAASFSPVWSATGSHAWNLVNTGKGQIVVDWMNYPPNILELFHSAGSIPKEELYDQFQRTNAGFPPFFQDPNPPNIDLFYEMQNQPLITTRNYVVYWNDYGEYLGTCYMPGGW